jgi:glucokinase-like ROK family protein
LRCGPEPGGRIGGRRQRDDAPGRSVQTVDSKILLMQKSMVEQLKSQASTGPGMQPSGDGVASAPADHLSDITVVLNLVRSGEAVTRPELGRRSGLGRTLITQCVTELTESGLLADADLGPSTGGRAPRQLRFRAEAGKVLVVELGATSISVGLSDLSGVLLVHREERGNIAEGPETTMHRVEQLLDAIVADHVTSSQPVWGVGIGVPGPVEFETGRPTAPPIMPGWDGYPVRDRLAARYQVPVWVDNEVNLMALGELRGGLGRGVRDFVFIKIGTGIGAGLISGGQLHRGAKGCAGDVGHIAVVDDKSVVCRCGNTGCLEALAGGAALARDGLVAAAEGRSPFLAQLVSAGSPVDARVVAEAAQHGDPVAVELLVRSGRLVGGMLATLVNFFNPALVLIGGGVAASGDQFLAAIRQAVYARSLPLATRELRLAISPLGDRAGLKGAGFMVADELFRRDVLGAWLEDGTPAGRPELAGS